MRLTNILTGQVGIHEGQTFDTKVSYHHHASNAGAAPFPAILQSGGFYVILQGISDGNGACTKTRLTLKERLGTLLCLLGSVPHSYPKGIPKRQTRLQ
jgi:hypothetical protein